MGRNRKFKLFGQLKNMGELITIEFSRRGVVV